LKDAGGGEAKYLYDPIAVNSLLCVEWNEIIPHFETANDKETNFFTYPPSCISVIG
jgi:hypothetical protein